MSDPGAPSAPETARKAPYAVEVEAGKSYYWCTCGRSQAQPFCDGAHKETASKPLAFTAEATGTVAVCGCKRTATPPFCDGSHEAP